MRGFMRGVCGGGWALAAMLALAPSQAAAQAINELASFGGNTTTFTGNQGDVTFTHTAVTNNRLILVVAARGATAPQITELRVMSGATEVAGDIVVTCADATCSTVADFPRQSQTNTHLWVFSVLVNSTTTTIARVRAKFLAGTAPNRMNIQLSEYEGLTRVATPIHVAGGVNRATITNVATNAPFSPASITTTRANTFILGATAISHQGILFAGAITAPVLVGAPNGSHGVNTGGATTLSSGSFGRIETITGTHTYNAQYAAGGAGNRDYVSVLLAYQAAPTRISADTNVTPLDASVCTASPFVFRIRSPLTSVVPPVAATTISVTSSSASARITVGVGSTPACPTGADTNTANVVAGTSDTEIRVMVDDPTAGTGKTLTAAYVSGGETLTQGQFVYDVNGGAVAGYCVIFPGQTFAPGVCNGNPGQCLVAAAPNDQVAGTAFGVTVVAVDSGCNATQPSPSSVSVEWYGFGSPGGDGSTPVLPSPLDFVAGSATTSITAVAGEIGIQPFLYDPTLVVLGASWRSPDDPHPMNINLPANGTTLAISHPNAVTATSAAVENRANGEIEVRVTNQTGGGIIVITVSDPDGAGSAWAWDPVNSSVWDSAGTTQIGTGWTNSVDGSGTLTFSAATSGTFASGQSLRFRARNTGGLYPDVASQTEYSVSVTYSGFQSGSATFGSGSGFLVRAELPQAVLPTVARSVSLVTPRITWTLQDFNVTVTAAGALVVRGTDPPLDIRQYAAGDAIGGSTVACRVTAPTTNCQDTTGAPDASALTYRVYQFDAFNGYSQPTTLDVPARPANGYVYRHTGTGLGTGALPDAESGGSAAPGASGNPFVVFTSNSNNGVYMVRANGSEQRRPVTTTDDIARRASAVRLNSGSYQVYAADTGSRAYRIDPTTNSGAQVVTLGAPVSGGPNGITSASFSSLNIAYNGNGIFFATNAATNNFVRAYRSDLTTPWAPPDFTFPDTTDGVSADSYAFTNNPSGTGIMMIPVGFGGGGIYGINLATNQPLQPAGWASQKIFTGTQFRSQCRRPGNAAHVFCGDTGGTIYAITAASGVQVGGTFNVGTSVLNLTPVQGGDVIVVTRAPATVRRLSFNGTTFTNVWGPISVPGATALSSPLVLNGAQKILVTGDTSATPGTGGSITRLNLSTGAVGATTPLDGDDVSDPTYDNVNDLVIMQTDTGTIWAKTGASL